MFFASVSCLPHVCVLGCFRPVWLFGTPMDCSPPGKNTGVFLCAPPGDLPNPGIKPRSPESPASPALQADFFYWWSPREAPIYLHLYWNAQIKKILPFCSSLLIIFKSHYCHPLLLSSSLSISSNVTLKTPLDAWCCDRRYTKELFSWVGWPCPNFQLTQLSQDGLLCYVSQAGCSETELVSCRGC